MVGLLGNIGNKWPWQMNRPGKPAPLDHPFSTKQKGRLCFLGPFLEHLKKKEGVPLKNWKGRCWVLAHLGRIHRLKNGRRRSKRDLRDAGNPKNAKLEQTWHPEGTPSCIGMDVGVCTLCNPCLPTNGLGQFVVIKLALRPWIALGAYVACVRLHIWLWGPIEPTWSYFSVAQRTQK